MYISCLQCIPHSQTLYQLICYKNILWINSVSIFFYSSFFLFRAPYNEHLSFDVFLTVHLSIILAISQLNAQNLLL